MKHFYFATTNVDKIKELQAIASNAYKNIIVSQFVFNGTEPEENGTTFQENSEIKFSFYKQHFENDGILATEDSGIEIANLNNFPSIHSARFLKQFKNKQEAFLELQAMLKDIDKPIEATFVCDICTQVNGKIHHFTEKTQGIITFEHKGEEGFGYDPIFIPNGSNKTFSQMTSQEKNNYSHRAKSFKKLINFIL